MKFLLDEYLDEIISTFRQTRNKYEAHLKAHPILTRMASDDEVIHEAVRRALVQQKFYTPFSGCGGPDYQINLINLPEVFLFASFFGPNKERKTDISYSTMHHHDDYLLSTINAKGPGYKSLLWKKGYQIDKEKNEAHFQLDKYVLHSPMNIEFIDAHTAHTVFFPKELTMTYALWSTCYPTNRNSKFKTHPLIQKNKNWLKKLLSSANVNPKSLGIAQYREDYFVPVDGKIYQLPGQVKSADDEHMVQNKLHIIQSFLGFDDTQFLKDQVYTKFKDQDSVSPWIEKYIENEEIKRNYESYSKFTANRNVNIEEYKKVYSSLN